MKSPIVALSNSTGSRIMSSKTVLPGGTLKRSVQGSPAALRRSTSSGASERHVPEYTQARFSACAAVRSASSSSAVQKHAYRWPSARRRSMCSP